MGGIAAQFTILYQQEQRDQLHQRAHVVLWTAAVMLPFFALLDFVVVPDHFRQFLAWRLAASFFCLIVIFFNKQDTAHRYPVLFGVTAYVAAGLTVSPMVVQLGGYSSFYYVGFILILVTFAAIFPLPMMQTAALGVLLYAIYAVPVFILSPFSPEVFLDFLANSFFFMTFIIIIVVQSRAENKARADEFNLRMKQKEMTAKLSFYADKLENEVKRRTDELNSSEKRYRDLYENIIDDVILVDRDGKILMGNPRFYSTLHIADHDREVDFLQLIHLDDVSRVRHELFDKLSREQQVTGCQFRLSGRQGKNFDVECNATVITKEGVVVGFQMLLRDISARKKLEQDLLHSLKILQETRSATILGLAKLSEYRDVQTGKHLERLREYCLILAKQLAKEEKYRGHITDQYIEDLYQSSILHDIGKVGIPDEILLKSGTLTREENEIIRQHATYGGNILKAVDAQSEEQSFLSMAKTIAYFHHEHWDGSGYPYGLRKEEIPLAARIVSLADAYDEFTTAQKYRSACLHEEAIRFIREERGRRFAPDIVDAFLECRHLFLAVRDKFTSEASEDGQLRTSPCYRQKKHPPGEFMPDFQPLSE